MQSGANMKCKFCEKETNSNQGNTYHERRCFLNPNRIAYTWSGKKHSEETIRKIGSSNSMGQKTPLNVMDMSSRTTAKLIKD